MIETAATDLPVAPSRNAEKTGQAPANKAANSAAPGHGTDFEKLLRRPEEKSQAGSKHDPLRAKSASKPVKTDEKETEGKGAGVQHELRPDLQAMLLVHGAQGGHGTHAVSSATSDAMPPSKPASPNVDASMLRQAIARHVDTKSRDVGTDIETAKTDAEAVRQDAGWITGLRVNRLETHRAPASFEPAKLTAVLDKLGSAGRLGTSAAEAERGQQMLTQSAASGEKGLRTGASASSPPARRTQDAMARLNGVAESAESLRREKSSGPGDTSAAMKATAASAPDVVAERAGLQPEQHAEFSGFGSPARQIADAVKNSLTNDAPAPSLDGTPDTTAPGAGRVVRVLDIDLHPAELGTVKVRMSLADGSLSIDIASGSLATVRMLEDQRDALSEQLRQPGRDLDVSISTVDALQGADARSDNNPEWNRSASDGAAGFQSQGSRPDASGERQQFRSNDWGARGDRATRDSSPKSSSPVTTTERAAQTGLYV